MDNPLPDMTGAGSLHIQIEAAESFRPPLFFILLLLVWRTATAVWQNVSLMVK